MSNLRVKVRSVWGAGMVSVASPYVRNALRDGKGLEIECKGAVMVVPFEKLKGKTPRNAEFKDRYGREHNYSLYDFFWQGGDSIGK